MPRARGPAATGTKKKVLQPSNKQNVPVNPAEAETESSKDPCDCCPGNLSPAALESCHVSAFARSLVRSVAPWSFHACPMAPELFVDVAAKDPSKACRLLVDCFDEEIEKVATGVNVTSLDVPPYVRDALAEIGKRCALTTMMSYLKKGVDELAEIEGICEVRPLLSPRCRLLFLLPFLNSSFHFQEMETKRGALRDLVPSPKMMPEVVRHWTEVAMKYGSMLKSASSLAALFKRCEPQRRVLRAADRSRSLLSNDRSENRRGRLRRVPCRVRRRDQVHSLAARFHVRPAHPRVNGHRESGRYPALVDHAPYVDGEEAEGPRAARRQVREHGSGGDG